MKRMLMAPTKGGPPCSGGGGWACRNDHQSLGSSSISDSAYDS